MSNTKPHILITGAEGLIGSALCQQLSALGTQIKKVDFADSKQLSSVEGCSQLLQNVDGVIHLAGVSRVIWGEQYPELCKLYNRDLTETLLKASAAQSTPPWFIFTSSKEVYGNTDGSPTAETANCNPISVYANSKREAEKLCEQFSNKLRVSVARLSTVYGGLGDYRQRVIPQFITNAIEGKPMTINGEGIVIDPTHISDVVEALAKLSQFMETTDKPQFDIFNISRSTGVTLESLAKTISDVIGAPLSIKYEQKRQYASAAYIGDTLKAREILSWQSKVDLAEGIRRYFDLLNLNPVHTHFNHPQFLPKVDAYPSRIQMHQQSRV